jgi:hypothetical protein
MPVRPATYGTYTTTVVVTGSVPSGTAIRPATSEVRISYLPQLYRYIFPLIYK